MKKEKNKNNPFCISNNKEKYRSTFKEKTHIKNPTTKLEMNLSHPIKINMNHSKDKLNLLESNSFKNKITISPKQFLLSKDKIIFSDHKNQKNINKNKKTENYLKHSINLAKNTSSDNINHSQNKMIVNDKNKSNIDNNEHENENETSMDNNDFYQVPQNNIKYTIVSPNKKNNNNNNINNYNTPNNFNQVYPNDPFNNDLFSNLFIDSSTDNKNILISELDIELSNIEQSNINKNNNNTENQNMNFIDDEEDTNQKSNEHINVYKKIELRFKSELEKNLKKYFQKNGANFHIGDSNINNNINHIKKETEISNKNKSNNNIKKEVKEKKDIKKVINSDGKMLHNINFTIDLRENCNKFNNINNSKLRLIKNNKENDNNKKYKKIIAFSDNKFKTNINNINNNIINRKSSKKKVKKEVSNKKKNIKQNMNSSSKTKTLEGEKKIKSIYSKVMTDEKYKSNKYKNSKEKGQEKYLNKNDNNTKKNNSTGVRQTYKNSPYYLHSINSIKPKKNNNTGNGNYNFKYNYNQLYHHKLKNKKNNIFIGEISISSSNNTQRKNFDEINKNNITYLNTNSKSVKNKNKLNRFFSFGLYEDRDKDPFNNKTQRSQTKIINNIDIKNNMNKKTFKSYNYKKRGKPINNYKGLNTEINNFNKIINFNIKSGQNKNDILNKKKTERADNKDDNDDLIKKRNLNNKVKSDLEDDDENSVFIYNKDKGIFLGYSPHKNILQNNSFKKI